MLRRDYLKLVVDGKIDMNEVWRRLNVKQIGKLGNTRHG